MTDILKCLLLAWAVLCISQHAAGRDIPEDGRYFYKYSAPPARRKAPQRRYTRSRRRPPYRREDHTAGVISLPSLAKTYSLKIERDEILDTYTLSNSRDRLVFVPNMGRFDVNDISIVLPIRPFHQDDRLYVPVEAVNFLRSPLPDYDKIPAVIRKRMKLSRVRLRKVFIDPGHGGRDPGAIGLRGTREKDVNLDIANRLAKLLEKQGVAVSMSRTGDCFVELRSRVKMGARSGSGAFISIHANACTDRSVSGVETFYMGTKTSSVQLAKALQAMLAQNLGVPDRGIKQRNLNVLRGNPLPAVLVEVGFLSNPDNEALLRQGFYRERIASIIVEALAVFSQRRPGR